MLNKWSLQLYYATSTRVEVWSLQMPVFCQLSHRANWELVIMWVYDKPIDSGYMRLNQWKFISTADEIVTCKWKQFQQSKRIRGLCLQELPPPHLWQLRTKTFVAYVIRVGLRFWVGLRFQGSWFSSLFWGFGFRFWYYRAWKHL